MSVSRPSDSSWFYFLLLVANFLSFSIQNRVPSGLKHFGLAVRFSSPSVSLQFLQEGICHKKINKLPGAVIKLHVFSSFSISDRFVRLSYKMCYRRIPKPRANMVIVFCFVPLMSRFEPVVLSIIFFLHSVHFWNTFTLKLDLCAIRQRRIALNEC